MHMIRKKAFGFPRCGLLAYHATETPREALTEMKSSVVAAGSSLNQVHVAQRSLVHCTVLICSLYLANTCGIFTFLCSKK